MSWEPYEREPYVAKEYTPYAGEYPRYYANKWYDREGGVYSKNPRYSKLFKLAMSRAGFQFAQWYLVEIFERSQLAFYDVDQAVKDWSSKGRPNPDPMPTFKR